MNRAERVNAVAEKLLGEKLYLGQRVRTRAGAYGMIVKDLRMSPFADWVVRLEFTNTEVPYVNEELSPA